MATQVEIINRGLTLVGLKKITSLTDGSPEAEIANLMYETSRDSVLEETLWAFATKRAALSQTTMTLDATERSMAYVYTKPTDCIKIFRTYPKTAFWREENDYIISDQATEIAVLYVYRNTSETTYPPKFVEALSEKLAVDIAYYTLNDTARAEKLAGHYEAITLPKAMASNSQLGTPYQQDDGYWVDAKYSNGSRKSQYGI